MTDNIFKQMREQMEPGQELLDNLQAAIEQDRFDGLDKDGDAYGDGQSYKQAKRAKRNPAFRYLPAAAAIILVFVAAGFLLQERLPWYSGQSSLIGESDSGQTIDSGAVRVAKDYQELYDIIKAAGTSYGRSYAGSESNAQEVITMAPQGDAGAGEAAVAAPQAPPSDAGKGSVGLYTNKADSAIAAAADAAAAGGSADGNYSETNAQVAGIDEGDIVKTDGRYIYVLSSDQFGQSELVVYQAEGAGTIELSRIALTVNPSSGDSSGGASGNTSDALGDDPWSHGSTSVNELYISGHTLLVIGSESYVQPQPDSEYPVYVNDTFVLCYDVSEPSAPVMVTQLSQSGYFQSSRLSNGILYLLSNYIVYGEISPDNPGGFVPLIGRDGAVATVALTDICVMATAGYPGYTVLSSIDTASMQRLDQKTVLGQGGTVYMSPDNIYIGSDIFKDEIVESYQDSVYTVEKHSSSNSTELVRIAIEDGRLTPAAQCTVPGQLLNQFSLDEYQGNLRLALTVDSYSYEVLRDDSHDVQSYNYPETDEPATNAIYVLSPEMTVVGSIAGLAADERIYSVRFDGAVGYMVTFKQVDPLFAIDLSDPRRPRVTSELKIPGFSTYLHPFGPGRLLGIGYDTKDSMTTGVKISMFDVSDPFNVREMHIASVTDGYGYSEALDNHKAVLVDVEKNIIGFPISDSNDSGYLVYQFTDAEGFVLKGRLEVGVTEGGSYYYYDYGVRGLYINDYLYVYSGAYMDIFELESLERVQIIRIIDMSVFR